jgi:tetratricopeptide (TPR) repeat protein
VTAGTTAETTRIESGGRSKLVVEWEADAGLEIARGEPKRGLDIYDIILAAFPRYAKAWYNKALLLHSTLRDFPRALEAYDRALEGAPGNVDILHNKAKLLAEMRRPRDAASLYEEVLRANPEYLKSLEGYSALLINAGRPRDAEPLLRRAEKIYRKTGEDPYRALHLLATALTNLGEPKEAVKVVDEALARHPNDDTLWEAKGIALSNLERYRDAVTCFTRALRLNRSNQFAWDTRRQLVEVCKERKIRFSDAELAI